MGFSLLKIENIPVLTKKLREKNKNPDFREKNRDEEQTGIVCVRVPHEDYYVGVYKLI